MAGTGSGAAGAASNWTTLTAVKMIRHRRQSVITEISLRFATVQPLLTANSAKCWTGDGLSWTNTDRRQRCRNYLRIVDLDHRYGAGVDGALPPHIPLIFNADSAVG